VSDCERFATINLPLAVHLPPNTNPARSPVAMKSFYPLSGRVFVPQSAREQKRKQYEKALLAIGLFVSLATDPARAQLVPDTTLPQNSTVTIEGNLHRIDGGTAAGSNLFHSFDRFDVLTGMEAIFNNSTAIDNIITRVTGDRLSTIDGTIRANGTANLLFVNPNGIAIGENASLDIGGSFLGSTADRIVFADGVELSAIAPETSPILTVSVPVGLQFGNAPGTISVTGSGSNLSFAANLATIRDDRPDGFAVSPGQTLTLVGGNLELSGGNLTAAGGRIELGSVLAGEVTFGADGSLNYDRATSFGDIRMNNAASVDASGNGGGNIQVMANNIFLDGGASVLADTLGNAPGGEVDVRAINAIEIVGESDLFFPSSLFASVAEGATGNGGNLTIEADRLFTSDFGTIGADTFGIGNAGIMTVRVRDIESRRSFWSATSFNTASGTGGTIIVEGDRLRILDGTQVLAFTQGQGNAGSVIVRTNELVEIRGENDTPSFFFASLIVTTAEEESGGLGGDILIETGHLILADGGALATATGNDRPGGQLTVRTRESIELTGTDSRGVPTTINSQTFTSGLGGDLTIETPRLVVRDGGQISSGTFGSGDGGNLTIRAEEIDLSGDTEAIEIGGRDFFRDESRTRYPSGLIASSENLADAEDLGGDAGNLTIAAETLRVADGAEVAVASNNGDGGAGTLTIVAEQVRLRSNGRLLADSAAGLGNIDLRADTLRLRDGSRISTNARGQDPGGNITLELNTLAALENSDITANATNSAGGRIQITADGIFGTEFREFLTPESDITATSDLGAEFSGVVEIQTPDVDPSEALLDLSEETTDASDRIISGCIARDNSFTVIGRGGLPPDPTQPFRGQVIWRDFQDFTSEGFTSSSEPDPDAIVVDPLPTEATTWTTSSEGKVMLVSQGQPRSELPDVRCSH